MTLLHMHLYFISLVFWIIPKSSSFILSNATELLYPSSSPQAGLVSGLGVPRSRRKRYISPWDMSALLDYHNQVRAQVSPPAANMEYMVWDERLAKSAEAWAAQCIWDHGPPQLMKYIGQNLSIYSGRYRSVVDLVKSWYYEKQHYSFPYPHECNPSCPPNAVVLSAAITPRGNWIGEAPYKVGRPCSACPPRYGGLCSNNMCFVGLQSNKVSGL